MDLAIGAPVLVLSLPVQAFVALAVRVRLGTPVLFRQQRPGLHGIPFEMVKFRTMRAAPSPKAADARAAAMTGEFDPRITRVGALLRKTRIDELPQIWNILKAEMSWIGPRPEAEVLSHWYVGEIPFYRYRHVVKPGISGWAQTNQGHVAEVEEIVPVGSLDPDTIHLPGIYVKRLILGAPYDKKIEFSTVRTREAA